MSQQRIFISSSAADRYFIDESRTDILGFDLNEPIICKSNERMYMSLETFAFSNSMYNITSDKNSITIDAVTFSIPVGQYNTATDLRTAIQSAMTSAGFTSLTISYTVITNKFSIQNTSTTSAVTIRGSSTLGYVIGLNSTDLSIAINQTVILPRQVDVSNGRTINFCVNNLDFNGLDSNGTKSFSSILQSIPITANFGEIQTFINPRNSKILINRKNLSFLDVSLINLNNEAFDVGGLRWSAVILITIE